MIQTRSHLKQILFTSSELFSTSEDYLSTSCMFPSPRKQASQILDLDFNKVNALQHRKSSTSLMSNHTLKSRKSYSSQTRSKLQQSMILKKAQEVKVNNDHIVLGQKQDTIQNYKKRLSDLKSRKAKLGEQVRSKQLRLLKKSVRIRQQIGKCFE